MQTHDIDTELDVESYYVGELRGFLHTSCTGDLVFYWREG
jgi:hypothetical protein